MEQWPKVVRDIVLTCVAQHPEDTPRWTRQGTHLADDIAVTANERVVYVPDENCRNPSWEAKHQPDLLKDYFNHVGELAGLEDRI